MKARISENIEKAINEKIMLDLEIHVLNKKIIQAERTQSNGLQLLHNTYKQRHSRLAAANQYLTKHKVKVDQPKRRDHSFIDYHFSQKVEGGYKEGVMSYWDIVLKNRTQSRINTYLQRGNPIGETNR